MILKNLCKQSLKQINDMIIHKRSAAELLHKAIPSFNKNLDKLKMEWKLEGEIPFYILLSELAEHICSQNKISKLHLNLESLFQSVEILFTYGDDEVREAITIGFLEGLQNRLLYENLPLDIFESYFGVSTKNEWINLIKFWEKADV